MEIWTDKNGTWDKEQICSFPPPDQSLANFIMGRIGGDQEWIVFDTSEDLRLKEMAAQIIGNSTDAVELLLNAIVNEVVRKKFLPCPVRVVYISEESPVIDPKGTQRLAIEINPPGVAPIKISPGHLLEQVTFGANQTPT